MQFEHNVNLTPELLSTLGFDNKGLKKGLYRKDDFCLQEQQSGFYIVDKSLTRLNKIPLLTIEDLNIFHKYFIGHSVL